MKPPIVTELPKDHYTISRTSSVGDSVVPIEGAYPVWVHNPHRTGTLKPFIYMHGIHIPDLNAFVHGEKGEYVVSASHVEGALHIEIYDDYRE